MRALAISYEYPWFLEKSLREWDWEAWLPCSGWFRDLVRGILIQWGSNIDDTVVYGHYGAQLI